MGEAKRRKEKDKNWGQKIVIMPMLKVFTDDPYKIDLYSEDYVDPSFKVDEFNIYKPHSQIEWQCAFFTSLESKIIDSEFEDPIARNNLTLLTN